MRISSMCRRHPPLSPRKTQPHQVDATDHQQDLQHGFCETGQAGDLKTATAAFGPLAARATRCFLMCTMRPTRQCART